MDETKELELECSVKLQDLDLVNEVELTQVAKAMFDLGADPEAVGGVALAAVLELLGFERGLILQVPSNGAETVSTEQVRPIATRKTTGTTGEWAGVQNPEFAVNRTVVARSLVAGRLVLVNDSLLQPNPASEAQHRTVLCLPFDLSDQDKAVLYLDRAPLEEVKEQDLVLLKEFVERCLHIVSRAYLLRELRGLRQNAAGELDEESEAAVETLAEVPVFHGIVGTNPKLRKLFQIVDKVKDNDLNICIVGESGTGKELLARAIHEAGNRREKTFVAENCGAISETLLESELFGHVKGAFTGADDDHKGLFEVADGGTLFLDEIGDTSEGMQRKLLRVLQEGVVRPIGSKETIKVDVRVICASNRDLKTLVERSTFRADLYYRLNVITLTLPPLRERPEDIALLVQQFTDQICAEENISKRFSESALRAMQQFTWPGNVRELRNVVRRVLITSPRRVIARKEVADFIETQRPVAHAGENIERDDGQITLRIRACESFNEMIDECERVILSHALEECSWNKSKVTKVLKIPRQSLYNKIAKYDLQRKWGDEEE